MDKGLMELEKLNEELNVLFDERSVNEKEILTLENQNKTLKNNALESQLDVLYRNKNTAIEAPARIKEYKNSCIINTIVSILLSVGLPTGIIALTISGSILPVVITLLITSSFSIPVFVTHGINLHCSNKERLNKYNLSAIEREITEKTNILNSNKNKCMENEKQIKIIEGKNNNLNKSITKILDRMNLIQDIRNEVIKIYCNNNLELDGLLNVAYEQKLDVKQKKIGTK